MHLFLHWRKLSKKEMEQNCKFETMDMTADDTSSSKFDSDSARAVDNWFGLLHDRRHRFGNRECRLLSDLCFGHRFLAPPIQIDNLAPSSTKKYRVKNKDKHRLQRQMHLKETEQWNCCLHAAKAAPGLKMRITRTMMDRCRQFNVQTSSIFIKTTSVKPLAKHFKKKKQMNIWIVSRMMWNECVSHHSETKCI